MPWGPGMDFRERLAEEEARAERARADAARLRRALVDAEVDLQRSAAAAASAQGELQARRTPAAACRPKRKRVAC